MSDTSIQSLFRNPRALAFGGAFMVIIFVVAGAYVFVLRQSYAVIVSDARPAEAAAIVAELDDQGIPYRLRDQGRTILVPTARAAGAHLLIAGSETLAAGSAGLEIFDESNMGLTEFAQRIRYQRAITGEMIRTILMMDNVADVRVHIAMPESGLFRGDQNVANAAIWVSTRDRIPLSAQSVEGIRRLAVASVPDLRIDNVAVLDAGGAILTVEPTLAEATEELALVSADEAELQLVEDISAPAEGAAAAVAAVNSEQGAAPASGSLEGNMAQAAGLEAQGAPAEGLAAAPRPAQTIAGTPLTSPDIAERAPELSLDRSPQAAPAGVPAMVWVLGAVILLGAGYYGLTRHVLKRPEAEPLPAAAGSFSKRLQAQASGDDATSASDAATPAFSPILKARLQELEACDFSAEQSGAAPRAAQAIAQLLKDQKEPVLEQATGTRSA